MTSRASLHPLDSPGYLLDLIRSGRATTRRQLGEVTGLARSTVSSRVEALLASGFISEIGGAASTGGRRATILGFNGDAGAVVAVDLGATHAHLAITNFGAEPMAETTADIDIDEGPQMVMAWLVDAIDSLLASAGIDRAQVHGIGVGVPGPVDFDRGMPIHPPIMAGWHEFGVASYLVDRYEVPVLVDNDVNIMALGEHFAMRSKIDDFVFVKVGTGIGSGLIMGGRIHRGAHGAAGDLGHVQIGSHEVVCRCGNTGCLEALAGGAALARALSVKHPWVTGSRDVVRLVKQGDKDAVSSVRSAGRLIGSALASVVNLLNPSLIVVGGVLASAEQQLLAGIREVVYQRSTSLSTIDLEITTSRLGGRAGITGAAAMVIEAALHPAEIGRTLRAVQTA